MTRYQLNLGIAFCYLTTVVIIGIVALWSNSVVVAKEDINNNSNNNIHNDQNYGITTTNNKSNNGGIRKRNIGVSSNSVRRHHNRQLLVQTRKTYITTAQLKTLNAQPKTKPVVARVPTKVLLPTVVAKPKSLVGTAPSVAVVTPPTVVVKTPVTAPVVLTATAPSSLTTTTTVTTATTEIQPADLPIRINTGYTASEWIDPVTKFVWQSDNSYDTTNKASFSVVDNFCGGVDALMCSYRHGLTVNYSIPVLQSPERYKITLILDEPMFSSTNSRLFDVYVEGVLMKSNVDPFLLAGSMKNKKALLPIVLNDRVKDGTIDISLQAVQTPKNGLQKALINGIIIELSPYRQIRDFPLRINSASNVTWIDPITNLEWLPDTDYDRPTSAVDNCNNTLNTTISTIVSKKTKNNINNNILYCSYRMGTVINYAIRVLPTSASYRVTFYMQEPIFTTPRKRIMDIFIESQTIMGGFDIVQFVGQQQPSTPATFTITTKPIVDGEINIRLKSSSGKYITNEPCIVSALMVELA